ncbi:MAG TPA: DUF2510 domain-containing protein [Homoserinimonas sp.]|nr:DUF2510 domain-containing protein [Homoserinimonas sp.]
MTDALSPTVPAGWYPDPWGSTSQRWWDGTSWTGTLDPRPENPLVGASVTAPAPPEPASSYRTAPAPTPNTPYPSRRALRELAAAAKDGQSAVATEDAPVADPEPGETTGADALPEFAQAPEFSPEPVSALPPPVWQDPEPEATAEPVIPAASIAEFKPAAASSVGTAAGGDDDWAASLARWDEVETTTPPLDALPVFGDSPPVSYSQRAMRYRPMHGRTSPVWFIVFMPIAQAASVLGSLYLFPGLVHFDAELFALVPTEAAAMGLLLGLRDWLLFAALPLSFAYFVFTFVMGFQDRARLRLLGHDETASPWWIVLSPLVYLIVRSIRVRQCTQRRGSGPLTTYLCLYVAPPIALIIAQAVTTALSGAIPV